MVLQLYRPSVSEPERLPSCSHDSLSCCRGVPVGSALHGHFHKGDALTSLNGCRVRSGADWISCVMRDLPGSHATQHASPKRQTWTPRQMLQRPVQQSGASRSPAVICKSHALSLYSLLPTIQVLEPVMPEYICLVDGYLHGVVKRGHQRDTWCADSGYCIPLSEQLAASPCSDASGGSECKANQLCFISSGKTQALLSLTMMYMFTQSLPMDDLSS